MAGPKRTKTEREEALAEVARLDRRGLSERQIAARLGVAPSQVHYDLTVLQKRYRESQLIDRAAAIAKKKASYSDIKAEAWEAWDRSKENKEKTTAKKVTTAAGGGEPGGESRSEAVKTVEGRLPDSSYLRLALDCEDRDAKLDGLLVDKIAPTTPDGTEPYQPPGNLGALDAALLRAAASLRASGDSQRPESGGPDASGDGAGP